MIGAAIFLLGALSAVQPPDRYSEALAARYPGRELLNNRSVYVLLDVAVRPNGTIMGCRVADSYGSHDFAERACAIVWHIILTPAQGPDGKPAFGRRKLPIKFITGGTLEAQKVQEMGPQPDYVIRAGELLPPGAENSQDIYLAALIEPDGSIADCELASAEDPTPSFVIERACSEVRSKKRFIMKTSDKKAVPYVDLLNVRLAR
jgi:hypothetical protein